MYIVTRDGKHVLPGIKGTSYEQVRSFLRKFIRQQFSKDTRMVRDGGMGEVFDNNPAISAYGYQITKIN
jgi:hypothetical protein